MHRPPRPPARARRTAHRAVAVFASACAVVGGSAVVATAAAAATPDSGPAGHPFGHLNTAVQSGQGIAVTGWAIDPDTSASARVRLSVDGTTTTTVTANRWHRHPPAHPGYGNHRGFTKWLATSPGTHEVCAYAVDYPSRTATWLLGCRTVGVDDPYGALDPAVQKPGFVTVTGWTIDPNKKTHSQKTTARLDGTAVGTVVADLPRDDVAAAHHVAGPDHGFSFTVRVRQGKHRICIKAHNWGAGANHTLGCALLTVNYSPTGVIGGMAQRPGGVRVYGWAADPDTTAPVNVQVVADGKTLGTGPADGTGYRHSGHHFNLTYRLPGTTLRPADHKICVIGINAGRYGANRTIGCAVKHLNYNPRLAVDGVAQRSPGAYISGWAADPDVSGAIQVMITADGKRRKTVTSWRTTKAHPDGHAFRAVVGLPNGRHTVCAIALNAKYGSANSAPKCRTITLNFNPYGAFTAAWHLHHRGTTMRLRGWAIDPDTTSPIKVNVGLDGHSAGTFTADVDRPDVAKAHPGMGSDHGFRIDIPADGGEHRVCVSAVNTGGGTGNRHFPCRVVYALDPVAPSAPRNVQAQAGYGGAWVHWSPPASDGGAAWTSYTVTSSPAGAHATVGASATAVTVTGLAPKTTYRFRVRANNVAGASAAGWSAGTTTEAAPPQQNTPAPISTSRYIRNIVNASSSEQTMMRGEGHADAQANPSGHGYLILLDIGGQDDRDRGVVLSAGVRFVTYSTLVTDLKAYVAGYAAGQRASAPVTIAIGTNNDMDVSATTGAHWADLVVDPVVRFARQFPGVTIAGANDIEPGFRASYSQSSSWVNGYLHATKTPFVFNGSADGCAWTQPGLGCNNGWRMSGLYHLAGGAAPIRIVNLPQVYNSTMAEQWRYISLTGVEAGHPRINFGGALTEWTACHQAGGCGSLTGNTAWREMWTQLRAEPKLRISSLPYSTDLRIDR